ncbi:rRNA maturation RNase YbeY [Candidatus Pelagibacter communis]|uniref:rRNA maturation RNase YbeY n=1 Tax=Pelagibacter ubique TaxID=198252 RepID=UPI00094CA27A|nr:rRNA maturation RNase YbeY [Candidatus Pelagibacter ubique]
MISVEVLSDDKNWSKKIKRLKPFFYSVCKSFPKKYRFINKKIFLTLLLSNNKGIQKLNKKFRNKNKPTDILSFPLNTKIKINNKIYLGDIIISYNFMDKPKNQKIDFFKIKVIKTFIHGFLHLLGFNHIKMKDYKSMLKEEEKIYHSVIKKIN